MSYEHETLGWNAFESFVEALAAAGITHDVAGTGFPPLPHGSYAYGEPRELQLCRFVRASDGVAMVVEEYLARDDGDCDGTSWVDIVIYPDGERPELMRTVLDGGQHHYAGTPSADEDGRVPTFLVNLTTDEVALVPRFEAAGGD